MSNQLKCTKCNFSLEPGAAANPKCPDCGEDMHLFSEDKPEPDREMLLRLLQFFDSDEFTDKELMSLVGQFLTLENQRGEND